MLVKQKWYANTGIKEFNIGKPKYYTNIISILVKVIFHTNNEGEFPTFESLFYIPILRQHWKVNMTTHQ